MAEPSIIIIGAGIAGLSAGCYAQMNGYHMGFQPGEKVHGIVTEVGPEFIIIDLNAKHEGDDVHHVYTVRLDGSETRRINGVGADACSFYFPSRDRLIWTSTRDRLRAYSDD